MLFIFFLSLILPLLLMFINMLLFKKHLISKNKSNSFECGFDPKYHAHTPFSLKFYLISVIFLIFDIEITLLLPIPLILPTTITPFMNLMMMIFIIILILGLFLEWNEGALQWIF